MSFIVQQSISMNFKVFLLIFDLRFTDIFVKIFFFFDQQKTDIIDRGKVP